MSEHVQQAFETWFKDYEASWGGWTTIPRDDCRAAFEAGYKAAKAESPVEYRRHLPGLSSLEEVLAHYDSKDLRIIPWPEILPPSTSGSTTTR